MIPSSFLEAIKNLPDCPEDYIGFQGYDEIDQQGLLATREQTVPSWLTDGTPVIRFGY